MRLPRLLLLAALGVLLGVAGALLSVALARAGAPDRVPVTPIVIAVVVAAYGAVALLVSAVRPRNLSGSSWSSGPPGGAWVRGCSRSG